MDTYEFNLAKEAILKQLKNNHDCGILASYGNHQNYAHTHICEKAITYLCQNEKFIYLINVAREPVSILRGDVEIVVGDIKRLISDSNYLLQFIQKTASMSPFYGFVKQNYLSSSKTR